MPRLALIGSGRHTNVGAAGPADRMKILGWSFVLAASTAFAWQPAPNADDAQSAHAHGTCGSLGPGSGLSGDKGWVVSMVPGLHAFRVRGGGSALVTVARQSVVDIDPGRPYYIVIEGAAPEAVLEWKVPGSDWGPVSKYFLYPLQR